MEDKKEKRCYSTLLWKLNSLDTQIIRVKDQIEELRKLITGAGEHTKKRTTEEICLEQEAILLAEAEGEI
tara:strand:+ start:1550 stop:1759 length:210 start_codon:yes stop_codon:yes gene_type:complete